MASKPSRQTRPATSSAGTQFERLVEIMRTLRSPDGCPWDREQTLESLRPFVLEEAYEVLDAIDRGDRDALRGEIGDLVFEGIFLAQLCAEEGRFSIADALESAAQKLIRRHPHVFQTNRAATGTPTPAASASAESRDVDLLEQWERLKDRERSEAGGPRGALSGIPRTLPALLRAYEIGSRASAVGFDWNRATDVLEKIAEELDELRTAIETEGRERAEEEMGDLLFALANLSRKLGIEPESALRRANEKFARRYGQMERRFHDRGLSLHDATPEEMEAAWLEIKDDP